MRYRCWGEEAKKAVVLKIVDADSTSGQATFLIIGINPRRRLDENYRAALEDLRLLILGSLKSIMAVSPLEVIKS